MPRINWSAIQQKTFVRLVMKGLNDWIFNLAGLLAYNLLLAMVPLFLLLIGGLGLALQGLAPDTQQHLTSEVARTLPPQISGGLIQGVTSDLEHSSGAILILGLIAAFFFGSRLFITVEDCFTIIYRVKPRTIMGRNRMALGMTLLFILFVPIMFLAAAVPAVLANQVIQHVWQTQTPGSLAQVGGFISAYLAAFLWLLIIYMLIPTQHARLRHSWPGAALAAALLILYELIFPWLASALLRPGKYGATAGFLILLLSFFYYFAFLLLVGAEFNSWLEGHRETLEDVPTVWHHAIIHGQLPQGSPDISAHSVKGIIPPDIRRAYRESTLSANSIPPEEPAPDAKESEAHSSPPGRP